jgi:opacity protein-like surface antigen
MAGPYVGLKIGCKFKVSGSGISAEVDCDNPDVDLGIRSTDFGVAFGAGVEMPMGSGLLTLGARYSMGLSDLVTDVKMKNSVISFGLGYFFGR